MFDKEKWLKEVPKLQEVAAQKPTVWINPDKTRDEVAWDDIEFTIDDIKDAEARLERFAPLLMEYFEDTHKTNGIIESPFKEIDKMNARLNQKHEVPGRMFLKMDSHLAVAGSIKARGGVYEVLYHAEKLALEAGLITEEDDYSKLASPEARELFSKYKIQVGSTGNLGMSIGITSAALGFEVIVHMSSDAKEWKKEYLRERGATVIEYSGDYTKAVAQGRAESDADPTSHFVDDENSVTLFLGYSVAALRLKRQIEEAGLTVDEDHPIFLYIPCGVGGAPGGVAFGVKQVFGDSAHVFFVEPTNCPSVLLGMATGLNAEVNVNDIGLTGVTEADGLACNSPSGFVGDVMKTLLSGIFTIEDKELFNYMRDLKETEDIVIEPSSCAAFEGPCKLLEYEESRQYLEDNNLMDKLDNVVHIPWATGGSLLPDEVIEENLNTYL